METTLSKTEVEEYFYNALCNGLGYMGGYGLELEYNEGEYKKSKAKWIAEFKNRPSKEVINKTPAPCLEDVLMQMLRDGYKLTMADIEGEGEMTRRIELNDIHERMPKVPARHLLDMVNENDDADTADVILQTVFFDGIVFG